MHHPKFLHVSGWRCWSWPRPYSQDSVGSYYPVILCYTNAGTIATGLERRIFLGVGDTQSGAGAENPPRLRVGLFHLPAAVPETDPQMPCSLAESLTCISDGKIRKVHPTLQKVQVGAGCRKRERERWERWADYTYTITIFFVYVWHKSCDRPNCLTAPFRVGRKVSACEEGESFCPRMQRHWVAVLASGVSLGCRPHAPINCLCFSNSLGCFSHCQETSASTDLMLGKDGGVSGINPP